MKLKAIRGDHSLELPIGKTVVGRGPLLKIRSTQVSRQHGELELTSDGTLTLRATHRELPCFYRKGTSDEVTLKPGQSIRLHRGDVFSMLPSDDDCAFAVEYDSTPARTPQPDAAGSAGSPPLSRGLPSVIAPVGGDDDAASTAKEKAIRLFPAALLQKKRALPDWMVSGPAQSGTPPKAKAAEATRQAPAEIGERHHQQSTTAERAATGKARQQEVGDASRDDRAPAAPAAALDTAAAAAAASATRGETEAGRDGSRTVIAMPTRAAADVGDGDAADEEEDVVRRPNKKQKGAWLLSDDSVSPPGEGGTGDATGAADHRRRRREGGSKEARDASLSPSPPASRSSCMYGKKCYRKNPAHFKEFAHPGDSDYEEDDGDDAEGGSSVGRIPVLAADALAAAGGRWQRSRVSRARSADSSGSDAEPADDDPDWKDESSDDS